MAVDLKAFAAQDTTPTIDSASEVSGISLEKACTSCNGTTKATAPFCNEAVIAIEQKIALKQRCDAHVAPLQQGEATDVTIAADVEIPLSIGAEGTTLACFLADAGSKPTEPSACELEVALDIIAFNSSRTGDATVQIFDGMSPSAGCTTSVGTVSSTSDAVAFPSDGTTSLDPIQPIQWIVALIIMTILYTMQLL